MQTKYEIEYLDPDVSLIDFNKNDDIMFQLWCDSRKGVVEVEGDLVRVGADEEDTEGYRKKITKMGLQYCNFLNFTLEIQGSALFRDMVFTINKSPQWATSLRFINSIYETFTPKNYPVSSEYKGKHDWEMQMYEYFDKIQETMVTDENRLCMPYSVSSKYWVQFNFKTFVTFISLLRKKFPFFYNIYGVKMLNCVKPVVPNIEDFLVDYIDSSLQQYFVNTEPTEPFTKVGDTVIMKSTMGLLLYSQFLRQQDSTIKGLWDLLVHDNPEEFSEKVFKATTEVSTVYVTDFERYKRTISNRVCWFSMSSGEGKCSWSSFLNDTLSTMSIEDFMNTLPCKFDKDKRKVCKCKYYEDIKFRGQGTEIRNLPCGLYEKNEEYVTERLKDESLLSKFYKKTLDFMSREEVL